MKSSETLVVKNNDKLESRKGLADKILAQKERKRNRDMSSSDSSDSNGGDQGLIQGLSEGVSDEQSRGGGE